jgi:fatty-acyl-CoA synthase
VRDGQHLDARELLRHVEANLARYKVPKSIEFVADLPHNASGKLLKSRLRKPTR